MTPSAESLGRRFAADLEDLREHERQHPGDSRSEGAVKIAYREIVAGLAS